jgi:uncharacterized protein YecE (DUF72 family)
MIRVGIGGWVFKPWRGELYPPELPQARELEYASRRLSTIEINGTFYRTQTPASFRKWASETPDDFVFSVKAPRSATQRRVLAEASSSIERFVGSGITELGAKLGPILWQLHPSKKFDPDDVAAFLELLPASVNGHALRHVIEAKHTSFHDLSFVALARKRAAAIALIDADKYSPVADVTADFVYARLQRTSESVTTGYSPAMLDQWVKRAQAWAKGGAPDDLPTLGGKASKQAPRDVFIYMISGAKARNPAAAMALIERLK